MIDIDMVSGEVLLCLEERRGISLKELEKELDRLNCPPELLLVSIDRLIRDGLIRLRDDGVIEEFHSQVAEDIDTYFERIHENEQMILPEILTF